MKWHSQTLRWTAIVMAVLALHGAALWVWQVGLMRWAVNATPVPDIPVIEMVVSRADSAQRPVAAFSPMAVRSAVRQSTAQSVQGKTKSRTASKSVTATALPRTEVLSAQPSPLSKQPVQSVQTDESVPEFAAQVVHESLPGISQAAPAAFASAVQISNAPAGPGSASIADAAGQSAQGQGSVVPPSSDAAYLYNPPPDYPPMSRLRNESGTVVVGVLIGTDGRAQKAQIDKSSGYERLDTAALTTALDRWRYWPSTDHGVPKAKWVDVKIQFDLQ